MKKILTLFLTSLFLLCCPNKEIIQQDAAPEASIKEVIDATPISFKEIDHTDWKILLPDKWEVLVPTRDTIQFMAINNSSNHRLMIYKEAFHATYDAYIIYNIRALKQSGIHVSSINEIIVNGSKFAFIKAFQDEKNIWIWLSFRNEFGWGFYCRGDMEDASSNLLNDCEVVFNSFTLK